MSKIKINPRVQLNNNMATIMNDSRGIISNVNQTTPTPQQFDEAMRELQDLGLNANGINNNFAITAYSSIYDKMAQRQKNIIGSVDAISNFYLVDVIKNTITDDALAPSIGDEDIMRYSCTNKKVEKELEALREKIGLDQIIENITPDLIGYGEYVLATRIDTDKEVEDELNKNEGKKGKRMIVKGKGITELRDIVDQGTVIALTQEGVTEGYLVENAMTKRKEIREVADFVKFTLGGQRVKVDTQRALPFGATLNPELKKLAEKLPRFIRVGKSMIYAYIDKLRELELIEKLAPASKLNQIARGNLVGMSLPENYDLEQAQRVVRKVEASINKKISIDPSTNEITVASILSSAGKTRIIPLMGDKGSLQNMDYKSDEPDGLTSDAKDIRELILDSIGVPSELIYKSDGDSKAEILKRNDKYVRRLKRVQKAIAEGCKQIAFIHLENKGIKFEEKDINIVFNNTLVGIGNLDKVEQAEVTVNLLSTIKDFFVDLAEEDSPFKGSVKLDSVIDYFENSLKTVGLADAIDTKEEGGKVDKDAIGYGDSKNITDDDLEEEPVEEEPVEEE